MSIDVPKEAERTKLAQLFKQLDENPGSQLQTELAALALSARTFDANSADLVACCMAFENLIVNPLLRPGKRRELREYSYEVVRLFQNAVAAGESFLAHCHTTVTRRYKKHPFLEEFNTHWKAHITGSPLCMFVKELRGYLLHKESISPMVSRAAVTDFSDPYDALCSIVLSIGALMGQAIANAKPVPHYEGDWIQHIIVHMSRGTARASDFANTAQNVNFITFNFDCHLDCRLVGSGLLNHAHARRPAEGDKEAMTKFSAAIRRIYGLVLRIARWLAMPGAGPKARATGL